MVNYSLQSKNHNEIDLRMSINPNEELISAIFIINNSSNSNLANSHRIIV